MTVTNIPTSSIVYMIILAVISFAVPITLAIAWKKRTSGSFKPILVGALTFIVFANIIEGAINAFVLTILPVGATIMSNVILYASYGAAMAAIFEETGRLVACKFILKKNQEKSDAISYGIGHGGIEFILVLGVNMLVYAIVSIIFNGGAPLETMAAQFGGTQGLDTVLQSCASISLLTSVLAIIERFCAFALHICLSLFVFSAVRKKKDINFFIAILIHFAFDFFAVIISRTLGIIATEVVLVIATAALVFYTFKVKKGDV